PWAVSILFFFQAEDGIRAFHVTGVQTCALPISRLAVVAAIFHMMNHATFKASLFMAAGLIDHETGTRDIRRLSGLRRLMPITSRSEERRVGKEWRSRGAPDRPRERTGDSRTSTV